jgi:nitrogen-specific signal transduction histidine kinase
MPTTPHPDILATAVLIVDAQQLTRYINPAAENLLGISAYHALERPVGMLLGECPELVRATGSCTIRGRQLHRT